MARKESERIEIVQNRFKLIKFSRWIFQLLTNTFNRIPESSKKGIDAKIERKEGL